MFEDSINILRLRGEETNILEAEDAVVKIPRTGIFICTGGWVNIQIDGTSYHVVKDSMVVYFAYSTFHITNHSIPLTGILIGADLETIQPLLYNISDFNAIFTIKQNPLTVLQIERMNRLLNIIALMEDITLRSNKIEKKTPDDSLIPLKGILEQQRKHIGQTLMLEIISCFTKAGISYKLDNRRDDVLKAFMSLLYKHFKEEHEVSFYADKLNLTCRYFSSVIKDRSGQTPSTWIATALLVEAKQQIASTTKSIGVISDELNFPNQSYFGKWFKTHTGISPLEFKHGKAIKETKEAELAKYMPNTIFDSL